VHAGTIMGLGSDTTTGLTAAIEPVLEQGATFGNFDYQQDDMAGGIATDASDYAIFLRNILAGRLLISTMLTADAVCTNPATCSTAKYSPIDTNSDGSLVSNESWHYALGHWIEDDPTPQPDGTTLGDGAFSSPGAFGFYPWIDASQTYYGVLAREAASTPTTGSAYYNSAQCGRMIRKAYLTGQAQLSAPTEPP
jgi:hypothetical protein